MATTIHHGPFVALGHIAVNVLDELIDALTVVRRKFLNIVMAGAVHIVRRILVPSLPVQLLSMVEWHNFISFTMDDVDWAVDVWHAVDVGKLVERQCPAEVEYDTKGRHQA